MENFLGLDDAAFSLREMMQFYKKEILEAYMSTFAVSPDSGGGALQHMGFEFTFTRQEITQFLAEEALEE